jgi:hypothetical protein
MNLITRRSFAGALSSMFAGAGVAAEVVHALTERTMAGDVATLVKCIDLFGAQAVAELIMETPGDVDPAAILRKANRQRNKRRRHEAAARRREAHAGTEVLYRGPLRVAQTMDGREVRSSVTRRRVWVGNTDREYVIRGIGVPRDARKAIVDINVERDGSIVRDVETVEVRNVTVPRGSRVLIDMRHGMRHEVWACELVRTRAGHVRLHLWQGATGRTLDETTPSLAGGVVYVTSETRRVGLLGLPLEEKS